LAKYSILDSVTENLLFGVAMNRIRPLPTQFRPGLIVSCQPVPGSPFDNPASVTAFALAAQAGGAAGLRIEGARNIAAVCAACALPLIGIIKRDLPDSVEPMRSAPRAAARSPSLKLEASAIARRPASWMAAIS
jgi:hypothetical protein